MLMRSHAEGALLGAALIMVFLALGLGSAAIAFAENPDAAGETVGPDAMHPPGQVSIALAGEQQEAEGASAATEPVLDRYFDRQWALPRIGLPVAGIMHGSAEVVVAVLDTGIDADHEDLSGRVIAEINLTDSPTARDVNGHGTHVAGIIAAHSGNGIGIAGITQQVKLLNVKVADDFGVCKPGVVAQGIMWAVDNGASIINVSLEFRESSVLLERAVDYAWSHGALVVAAAGNDAAAEPIYPACYENCIAVGATGRYDELAPLSNYGDWVDVVAPGHDIYSALPGNKYGYETGTSFAAAHVSGLAALAFNLTFDRNGDGLLNDEVRASIEGSAQPLATTGMGRGMINGAALLALIR